MWQYLEKKLTNQVTKAQKGRQETTSSLEEKNRCLTLSTNSLRTVTSAGTRLAK